jgi:hypothetical protein
VHTYIKYKTISGGMQTEKLIALATYIILPFPVFIVIEIRQGEWKGITIINIISYAANRFRRIETYHDVDSPKMARIFYYKIIALDKTS